MYDDDEDAKCWRCHGSGFRWSEAMTGFDECGVCMGTGELVEPYE